MQQMYYCMRHFTKAKVLSGDHKRGITWDNHLSEIESR